MAVYFNNNYLRPRTPIFVLPGVNPAESDPSLSGYTEKGHRYPVDKVANDLVRVVGQKGWDIPGIDVVGRVEGPASESVLTVSSIMGGEPGMKWHVKFGRTEFGNGTRNISTAVFVINTPKQELTVFSDGSGPDLCRYAGPDWMRDEDAFMRGCKVNSRLAGGEKTYLKYRSEKAGDPEGDMVCDNDMGREYDPEPAKGERERISKKAMFRRAARFLTKVIHEIDERYPDSAVDPRVRMEQLARIVPIPVRRNTPEIFVFLTSESRENGILVPGRGTRLCSMDVKNDPQNPFPKEAYRGFSYGLAYPQLLARCPLPEDTKVVKATLKYANDIYVVDRNAQNRTYAALRNKAIQDGGRGLSDAEFNEIDTAVARTMVPLSVYDRTYADPCYLIGRPLGKDEAKDLTFG